MPAPQLVVRIAHAYGNSPAAINQTLASDADMIEADIWYRRGRLEVRHEHHARWFPLLIDRRMKTHRPGKWAVRIGNYYIRPDIGTQSLDDVMKAVAGKKKLLLDVKGYYSAEDVDRYVAKIVRAIREHKAEAWVAICGQTYTILHRIREVAPDLEVRFSIEREYQWERFLRLIEGNPPAKQVCISYRFIDDAKAQFMDAMGVNQYCWTVDDWDAARRLVANGVDGIISNDLELLSELHGWVPGEPSPPAPSPTAVGEGE